MDRQVIAFFQAAIRSIKILILDNLPITLKRKIYSKRLSGDELELRLQVKIFGGMKMFMKFWKVALQQDGIEVGQALPDDLQVTDLSTGKPISISKICNSNIPMILNFGSCS